MRTQTEAGLGVIPPQASHWTFTLEPTVEFFATPEPITPPGTQATHVPNLTWQPVSGATSYEIWTSTAGANTYSLYRAWKVNSYTETGAGLPLGTYDWYVVAKGPGPSVESVNTGQFSVVEMPATVLTGPAHCATATTCAAEPVTPRFSWEWDPDAHFYYVYFARDPNFTNSTGLPSQVRADYPEYIPTANLPDVQAGQALYWYARPCYGNVCGPAPSTYAGTTPPIRAFAKRSNAVELLSPADETGQNPPAPLPANQDHITFTWRDYLLTNQASDRPNGLEALHYELEISTSVDMTSVVHRSPKVDQTTYTMYSGTLPDGPLYWRVRVFDRRSALAYSDTWLVHKLSPAVSLTSPTDGASVTAVPLFSWESQAFAASYDIEVYKNINQPLATSNRVLSASTQLTDWSPTSALPSGEYGWRVRRKDSAGKPGAWTSDDNLGLRTFTVTGDQATLLSPAPGAHFPDDNQSFVWAPAERAARYQIQISSSPSFATMVEDQTTVMTSWHSTARYPNGTYYWRVTTIDGQGNKTAISDVRSFIHGPPPPDPVYYHPISPVRILDSRPDRQVGPFGTKWSGGVTRTVPVANVGGVPAGSDAVTLNVTVTGTTANGYLKIWPNGQSEPLVSSLNWRKGATVANAVTITVGSASSVRVRVVGGSADVIFDTVGFYDTDDAVGGGFTGMAPKRLLDSRPGKQVGPYSSKWAGGTVRSVVVAGGSTGVPADADAVVLNVTATGGTRDSYLTVWPKGQAQPTASSVNFGAGQNVPNAVTAKVGSDESVNVYNNFGAVDVVIDVVGYFEAGEGDPYRPLANPVRIQDSRPSGPQVGPYSSKWGSGTTRTVQGTGEIPANIPSDADSILLNVTVTGTTAESYLTVYPDGAVRPTASNLNWTAGVTVPNAVTAKLGTGGRIRAFNASGQTDVIMDVFGYYGT